MLRNYALRLHHLAIVLVLFMVACTYQQQTPPESTLTLEEGAATAIAGNTFGLDNDGTTPHLAIELEITPEGANPVGATIVYAPPQSTKGIDNYFNIRARAGDEVIAEYEIPDPRIVEVEGSGREILPSANIFVYVPLSKELTELQIEPLPTQGQAEFTPTMVSIDLPPLLQQACVEQPEFDACQ